MRTKNIFLFFILVFLMFYQSQTHSQSNLLKKTKSSGTHRYFFKLYALDIELALKPGSTKQQLLKAMMGHILSEAQLIGKYKRG